MPVLTCECGRVGGVRAMSADTAWGYIDPIRLNDPAGQSKALSMCGDASARQQASMLQSRDTNQTCSCIHLSFVPWCLEGVRERIGSASVRNGNGVCNEWNTATNSSAAGRQKEGRGRYGERNLSIGRLGISVTEVKVENGQTWTRRTTTF